MCTCRSCTWQQLDFSLTFGLTSYFWHLKMWNRFIRFLVIALPTLSQSLFVVDPIEAHIIVSASLFIHWPAPSLIRTWLWKERLNMNSEGHSLPSTALNWDYKTTCIQVVLGTVTKSMPESVPDFCHCQIRETPPVRGYGQMLAMVTQADGWMNGYIAIEL